MEMLFRAAVLVVACMCTYVQGEYVASKQCSQAESCLYSYSASEVSSMSGSQSKLYIRANVEVFCDSVGKYEVKEAKRYCLNVKEVALSAGDDGVEKRIGVSSEANKLLSGPFCFVQAENGRVVSVHYKSGERAQIVNFKKGIAAAFQANFKNTHIEIEEDTQSKHYSRYSYKKIAPDHVIMHRIIDSESVIEFAASDLNGKPLKVDRAEDIEYKEGRLLSSAGTTVVNMNGPIDSQDEGRFESSEGTTLESGSNTFSSTFGTGDAIGAGQYSLRLQACTKKLTSAHKRSAEQRNFLTASNLHAVPELDSKQRAYEEMSKVRRSVPSIKEALVSLKSNTNDSITSNSLKKLLILESEYGPLAGSQPAITEVMTYLDSVSSSSENDLEMKALLYSLLAADGSANSQQIILHAIMTTTDIKLKNSLTVQMAFIRNIHPDSVAQIESLIVSSNDATDSLILSYGALASSSTPELKRRIVEFLQERVNTNGNVTTLIHHIHSLGNTESSLADNTLIQLIANNDSGVRLAAVYALRYSLESKNVQNALLDGLHNQDPEFAEMVVRAMIAGAESKRLSEVVPVEGPLFDVVMQHAMNNTDLRAMVTYYVKLLGPNAPKEWINVLRSALQKRGTQWNDNSDSLFNLVEDLATRNMDLSYYPINKAYIYSKSIGTSDVKLDVAFGAFAGFGGGANPSSFKVFAKGIARGYAFGHTATAFEALVSSENQPGGISISNRLYASLVGKVLIDYSREIPTCHSWSFPLYKSPEYTLLQFKYSIFIYVGTLDFTISLTAKLGITATLQACINRCTSATAAIVPQVTVSAIAGASATLIEIARGGIDLAASFEYNLSPQLTGSYLLLNGPFTLCLTLSHGWPNNVLSLYAYYQLRSVTWCSGWWGIKYPCGFSWGDKNKWSAASKEWSLPSTGMTPLWSSCDSTSIQCA